ncbi:MAG: type II toxin-antitoxin system ParD family antitoxin [Planctomycetota bacterium]
MTVSLPTKQKAYVASRAAASGCSTPSEYVRRLIHADQQAREEDALERRVLEGLDSPSREMGPKEWDSFRTALRRRLSKAKRDT